MSRYLLAVLRSIPVFIAAKPVFPHFVFSSISRLTCASLTVTEISLSLGFSYWLTRFVGWGEMVVVSEEE